MRVKLLLFSLMVTMSIGFSVDAYQQHSEKNKHTVYPLRIEREPKIDGKLTEPFWQKAQKIELNYEIQPRDNAKPNVETEVAFLYDSHNFYIGFICYEKNMEKIRAHITERDHMLNDDIAVLIIDTFGDLQKAYEFGVNPYGIQFDATWTPNNEDLSYDMIWHSSAQMLSDRWTVEIKVPFKSLKFPQRETQEWRIHVARLRPRSSREQISWMKIDRNNPSLMGQAGWIKGMRNIEGGKFLHILPYAVSSQLGERKNMNKPESNFVNKDINGDFGVGLKYGLTSNLNLDFVYNPDFSQVESDPTKIDVNTTFALFYPERRPFFQEGIETFHSHLNNNFVYTRTINNPLFAGKLTGKMGKFKIGYISAYDRNTPYIIPFEETSRSFPSQKKSFSNILRLKYDLGGESYIGSFITDRESNNGTMRNFSADATFHFLKNYYWEFQLAGSYTKEPIDSTLFQSDHLFSKKEYTATFDGEDFYGTAFYTRLRRSARNFSFFALYEDYSPTFRVSNGFIRNNNYRMFEINSDIHFYPATNILDQYNISPEISWEYNHFNQLKNNRYDLEGFLQLKKQTHVNWNYTYYHSRFNDKLFKNLYTISFFIKTEPSKYYNIGMYTEFGRDIFRTTDDPRKAFSKFYSIFFELKPKSNFILEGNFDKYQLDELNNKGNIFDGYTVRGTINYQYNKYIHFRLISQYNAFSDQYQIDPLIRVKLDPFTIFYIGSTHDYKKFDSPHGVTPIERQVFMKLQYLFQV